MPDGFSPTEAFAQHLTQCQPALYGYIISLIGDSDAAEDLLQQVNLVLWRKAGDFEAETNFKAWACRVAYYEVLTARKRFARDRLLFDESLLSQIAVDAAAATEQSETRRRALRQCMDRLSPSHRQLLQRHYANDETIKSIAESLSRPLQSVYQTFFRIRVSLLECVRRQYTDATEGES
ncbi:sigma-70 family RNA polymerase sigma factor [Planctomycetales bacterium ZRK34]|nr:sigma-70 family RNA polymerase sigma factor [Planctomycetales bacterium ZRK34]